MPTAQLPAVYRPDLKGITDVICVKGPIVTANVYCEAAN